MAWNWFDLAWPWIGAIAAGFLLVLLFGSNKLRSNPSLSRWHDPVWLAWWTVPVYMIHNIEEYGIDMLGQVHQFPDALCVMLGLAAYPACPIPPPFYLAVNLSLIWVAAPMAALLSPEHPLAGLTFYGLLVTNGITHVVPLLLGRGYSPGTLSAILPFFPSFFWCARTCFGPGRLPYKGLAAIVTAGAIVHMVLIGSVLAYIHGMIGSGALVAFQLLNAGLFLCIPRIAERRLRLA